MLRLFLIVDSFLILNVVCQHNDETLHGWALTNLPQATEEYTTEYDVQLRRSERVSPSLAQADDDVDSGELEYYSPQFPTKSDPGNRQQYSSLSHKDYEQILKETHLARLKVLNKKQTNKQPQQQISSRSSPHVEQYLKEVNPTTSTVQLRPRVRYNTAELTNSRQEQNEEISKATPIRYLPRYETQPKNFQLYQYETREDQNEETPKSTSPKNYQQYEVQQDQNDEIQKPLFSRYVAKNEQNYEYNSKQEQVDELPKVNHPSLYAPKPFQLEQYDSKPEQNDETSKPFSSRFLSRKNYQLYQDEINEPTKPKSTPFNIVAYQNALLAQQKALSEIENDEDSTQSIIKKQKSKQRPSIVRQPSQDNNYYSQVLYQTKRQPQIESINRQTPSSKYRLPLPTERNYGNEELLEKSINQKYELIPPARQLKSTIKNRNPIQKLRYQTEELSDDYQLPSPKDQTKYEYDDQEPNYNVEDQQYTNLRRQSSRQQLKTTRFEPIESISPQVKSTEPAHYQSSNANYRLIDTKVQNTHQRHTVDQRQNRNKQYLKEVYRTPPQYADLSYQPSSEVPIRHPIRAQIILRNLRYETDPTQSQFITAYVI